MSVRDIGIALLVVMTWGVNFVALKWSVIEIPPFLLTGLRYLLAALPAVLIVPRPKMPLFLLLLYGTVIGTFQFGFLFVAIRLGLPAGLASLLMQTQAFFTFGLAVWLLGERPGVMQILGATVAFAGIGVIALERLAGATLLPLLLTLAAAFSFGASNIITKKAGAIDMLSLVAWGSLVPPIPMFVLSLLFEGPGALAEAIGHVTLRGGLSLLFSAYVITLVANKLWADLLGRYPANTVAPFTLLVPIFGITSSMLLLDESISLFEVAGGALVFLGLIINTFGPRLGARRMIKA